MKCQSILKSSLRNAMFATLIIGACSTQHATAIVDNIDEMQGFIKAHSATPDAAIEYDKYARKFENLLEEFLKRSNNKPLSVHIASFDQTLEEFNTNIVLNPKYASIKEATQSLHARFCQLVDVIRRARNERSTNTAAFLASLQPFLNCVPGKVRSKYNNPLTLYGCVSHRLNCK